MEPTVKFEVDVEALNRVLQDLPNVTQDLLDSLAETLKNDVVQSFGTSPSSPGEPPGVDTGTLRASIDWKAEGDRKRIVHDGVEYGVYLELGTDRGLAPRPFMGPAFERLRGKLPGIVRDFGIVK
ncbi:MAG: hypothetical protein LC121_13450 [Anaerolineae bacterium]|nr:hypothetical protein [Anaerolineae bacterium]